MRGRRLFIIESTSWLLGASLCEGSAWAQNPSSATLPSGIGIEPDFEGPVPPLGGVLGKSPALKKEQQTARAVLAKAPKGPAPLNVATYFLAVGNGDYGANWKPYVKGWPERWNPVIVSFFQATRTNPEGDVTSWCAAFLNWCFQQVNSVPATASASSGSFRSFGTETSSPAKGDIVVFQSTNPVEAAAGHGHVGFFVADYGEEVDVLGGNQIEGHERSHMVSSKRLKKNGPILKLHSYRTDSRLRSS